MIDFARAAGTTIVLNPVPATALRFGNATGALAVTKVGTAPAMPTRAEIDALYKAVYGRL